MNGHDRRQVQAVCSLLLRYPDDTVLDLLPTLRDAVGGLPDEPATALNRVLEHFDATDPMDLQRHYVETFDMRRKCSPYLTYWTHGDTRNRGMALLHVKAVYGQAGLTIDEEELPDHLAVVLEFAASGDADLGNALLAEHRAVIALLHSALVDAGSCYAHVVAAVLSTTPEPTADDELLMQRIAAGGPPTETVGMAGPLDLTLTPFSVGTSDHAMGARR